MAGKPKRISEFTPEMYRQAATEHMGSLQSLYDNEEFVLAAYVSGLAVECLFRAYRSRIGPEFESRHDLYELSKEAKFADVVPAKSLAKYESNLGVVATRWSNSHRYRTEDALRRLLKRRQFDRRIKGDFLKENVRLMVSASSDIVTLGAHVWTSKYGA
ncbi:MAG TPA: hypothetical protein VG326_06395 [Tepidisphaeraceae bacterium]|jgi:hypothetical protein|nr:hypothetical protein [Tepidisphaeraceae bacterium]